MSQEKEKHHIYLAVPGKQFCWGTTTSVINSTLNHIAHPFNGGMGFSGTIDFNICLTDAMNLYEAGTITHFAMLHGDISVSPRQFWLDILMEEMEARDADLVSVTSPIKDFRGITSCGIGESDNAWGAYRRFTQKEVVETFPDTWDAASLGYPDKVLLHNTACWVCDLRKPVFHEQNEDGSLKHIFKFPERIIRNDDGKWEHQQESEDWYFSRSLWEAGVRNTWITKRVKFDHHGALAFPNYEPFGQFKEGDDNTANRWREDLEAKPLALTQILQFELGIECNLAGEHPECPNRDPLRFARLNTSTALSDDIIVSSAVEAYLELGFTGYIGWIYYNEPLMQADRMFRLMARIKEQAPTARFMLWTNGTLIPEDCEEYSQFGTIVISGYNEDSRRGLDRLLAKKINARWIENPLMDNRLVDIQPKDPKEPCLRPFVELIFDAHGNSHLCCYDWQGKGTFGNIVLEPLAVIAHRWRDQLPDIAGTEMSDNAPAVCKACGHRWAERYQMHDEAIVNRAKRFRATLEPEAIEA